MIAFRYTVLHLYKEYNVNWHNHIWCQRCIWEPSSPLDLNALIQYIFVPTKTNAYTICWTFKHLPSTFFTSSNRIGVSRVRARSVPEDRTAAYSTGNFSQLSVPCFAFWQFFLTADRIVDEKLPIPHRTGTNLPLLAPWWCVLWFLYIYI